MNLERLQQGARAVAQRRLASALLTPARLAEQARLVSSAYTLEREAWLGKGDPEVSGGHRLASWGGLASLGALAARLLCYLALDAPKLAIPIREARRAGLLTATPTRPTRWLDLGAGLGAASWGALLTQQMDGESDPGEVVLVE